jgi:endonuclease YncB( thermonuclease family)
VPKRSTILAFVLLFVVGTVLFVFLSPENFYPVQNSPTQTGSSPERPSGAEPATVNYVHDGDTLFLETATDDNLKVRLLAVDTPEVDDCYGSEATAFLRELLPEGSTVFTLADTDKLDQYGRSLLMVWTADGTLVNLELVAKGYAEAVFIGGNRMFEHEIEAAEDAAQDASLGIWGSC